MPGNLFWKPEIVYLHALFINLHVHVCQALAISSVNWFLLYMFCYKKLSLFEIPN
jgi:hypothetical protein